MNNKFLEYMLYESESDPIGLPDGVLFLSENRGKKLEEYSAVLSELFRNEGYQKVVPPVFEYYETFEKGSGLNIARKSFSFKDKEGKLLSLRYDMTTPIARMIAMQYSPGILPLKYYYTGDVYREQPLHKGKLRQIFQAGVECIGESGARSDAGIINLMGRSLEIFDLNYKIVVGDVFLYRRIISEMELNSSREQAIHSAVNKKDIVSLKEILKSVNGDNNFKEILLELPLLTGGYRKIKDALYSISSWLDEYIERLNSLLTLIPKEIREHIIIDLGLIKDFSYYSSITLEGYIEQAAYPIAGGGRYDNLFQSFGRDYPASGFALDLSFLL